MLQSAAATRVAVFWVMESTLTRVAAGLAGQEMQANAKPTAALGDGAPGSEDPTLKLPKVSMLQLRLHLVERTCLAVHDHVQAATCRVGCRGL